jgi:hypothetical protein
MRDLHDWIDDLARAHTAADIDLLRRHDLEVARQAGRAGVDSDGNITTPAFDPLDGTLVDIVTVVADVADSTLLTTGMGIMLGEPPFLDEIDLYPTPLDWLRAGADGICVINWDEARRYICGKPPLRLICRNREHAAEAKAKLWLDMPRLLVAVPDRIAA